MFGVNLVVADNYQTESDVCVSLSFAARTADAVVAVEAAAAAAGAAAATAAAGIAGEGARLPRTTAGGGRTDLARGPTRPVSTGLGRGQSRPVSIRFLILFFFFNVYIRMLLRKHFEIFWSGASNFECIRVASLTRMNGDDK